MAYTLKSPDKEEVKDYLFSGENIPLSLVIDPLNIESTINKFPEAIITNGIFALGPALKDYPRKEIGSPGKPENGFNLGLLGIYIPPEFANELDREEPPLELPLKIGKYSKEKYINAAQHVITRYNKNADK